MADGSSLRLQSYHARTERHHVGTFNQRLDTFDVEIQYAMRALGRHQLTWGGGYRNSRDRVVNSAAQAFVPAARTLRSRSIFVQDEIQVQVNVRFTLGVKAEDNIYTGTEWLPSSLQPQAGGAIFANDLQGRTSGIESWASYQVNRAWRISGGFVLLDQELRVRGGGVDAGGAGALGNDPSHWWTLRSSFNLTSRHPIDLAVRRVGAMDAPSVPAYTAVDGRFGMEIA